jgi:hypothetical protein
MLVPQVCVTKHLHVFAGDIFFLYTFFLFYVVCVFFKLCWCVCVCVCVCVCIGWVFFKYFAKEKLQKIMNTPHTSPHLFEYANQTHARLMHESCTNHARCMRFVTTRRCRCGTSYPIVSIQCCRPVRVFAAARTLNTARNRSANSCFVERRAKSRMDVNDLVGTTSVLPDGVGNTAKASLARVAATNAWFE